MTCSLDELRQRLPDVGVAVYAYEPGGPVTLEIHAPDGATFTFVGPTLAAAMDRAFASASPEPESPPPDDLFD